MKKLLQIIVILSLFISGISFAGAYGGSKILKGTIKSNSTISYKVPFIANRNAFVIIYGSSNSRLECLIYDSNYLVVWEAKDPGDYCFLHWVTNSTDKFKIVVRNLGEDSDYILYTN